MRSICGFLFFVFLLSFSRAWGQEEYKSVLDRRINIESRKQSVASILDQLSQQYQVFFSYDASSINTSKSVDISLKGKTIKETLDILFDKKYVYESLGEQVIITRPRVEVVKKAVAETAPPKPKVITFKGKIIDREQKDALPYASITVLKNNIRTVSNIDGDFELKIPESMREDTIVFSCMGYRQYRQPISEIDSENCTIYLQPTNVLLKEIKVAFIYPSEILKRILGKVRLNYSSDPEMMTSFYREVLKQDGKYIDVTEALMEIKKAPYDNYIQDKVKLIKGRKTIQSKTFKYVDFKIQGGPYYITKLDVIKTMDSFLDPEFQDYYKFELDQTVEHNGRDTYIIKFKPREKVDYPCYQGKLYVDMSSFALVFAEFHLSRSGLKYAQESLIKKKPKDFYVRPLSVNYRVSYSRYDNKWHFNNAQTSINFKVKSKRDKVNSSFQSISELQITDSSPDDGTRYKKDELFKEKDIFSEIVTNNDESFWGDYNTIKPSVELRDALSKYYQKEDTTTVQIPKKGRGKSRTKSD